VCVCVCVLKTKENYAGSRTLPAPIKKRRHICPKCRESPPPCRLNEVPSQSQVRCGLWVGVEDPCACAGAVVL